VRLRTLLFTLIVGVMLLAACANPPVPAVKKPVLTSTPIPTSSTIPQTTPTPSPTSPTPTQFVLQTVVNPPDGGTVSPGSGAYSSGDMVYFIATPASGYRFVSWSGDIPAGIELSLGVWIPIDQDRTLQANFELTSTPAPTQYILTTSINPRYSGTISHASGSTYSSGQILYVTATPASGYRFVSWSGDIQSTSNPITIIVDRNLSVTANFEVTSTPAPTQYVLNLSVSPPGGGTISHGSGGTYSSGQILYVTATPASGYRFVSWSGDIQSTSNPITIIVDRNLSVTANFEVTSTPAPTQYVLNLSVSPPGGGTISHGSGGTYPSGHILYVTATPSPGYRFVSWSGDIQSMGNPVRIIMNRNRNVTANFELILIPGTIISRTSPLYDERFVCGETVRFKATVTCSLPCDGSQLQWTSDLDGYLGNGTGVSTSGLSVGRHAITVSGYGGSETFPVRVFAHLGDLYLAPPAEGEIQRILSDFTFVWANGTGVDEDWSRYDSFNFDQNSADPSKVVIIAKLDLMRHQRFTEPLPMTNGKTIYDHFRTYVHNIEMRLDCGSNMAWSDWISLSRSSSVWDGRVSGGDACKTPSTPLLVYPYIYALQLYVHEGRHCEPDDPGHTNCGQVGAAYSKDSQLAGGSGYAWAALYMMWVYKYSLYDPPDIRECAGSQAAQFLRTRFCTIPTHSDPAIQATITELLQRY
jgi:hypothetical protein